MSHKEDHHEQHIIRGQNVNILKGSYGQAGVHRGQTCGSYRAKGNGYHLTDLAVHQIEYQQKDRDAMDKEQIQKGVVGDSQTFRQIRKHHRKIGTDTCNGVMDESPEKLIPDAVPAAGKSLSEDYNSG